MRDRTKIKAALAEFPSGTALQVAGWARSVRVGKEVTFIALNDGSCVASLQVVAGPELPNYAEICRIGTGTALVVRGRLAESPAAGQKYELQADCVEIAGLADETYPMQKKRHGFEYLRTVAHLRPRTNTFGAVFRVRSSLALAIHQFFAERGFLYVHTPIITANDCEGAGELFRVTTLDMAHPPLVEDEVDYNEDFFGQATGLTVSGQLEGELFALAFTDIYTFGPTFRAENSNTARHAAEFWMIEPEIAFADLMADAELAEEFFRYLCRYTLDNCREDLEFFNEHLDNGLIARIEKVAGTRFAVMEYTEAVNELKKAKAKFEFPVEWGLDLQSEHERYITEQVIGGPLFIINYPKEIKAFYMRMNDDNRTVAAMDLLVPKVGEIIGGSQREERLDLLTERMNEVGIDHTGLWWYMDTRRWGSCPHAGFGLGFERLLMYLTGMENIRDVIPFPRTPRHAEF
jgi:asparaginyl-tRNA synthetase